MNLVTPSDKYLGKIFLGGDFKGRTSNNIVFLDFDKKKIVEVQLLVTSKSILGKLDFNILCTVYHIQHKQYSYWSLVGNYLNNCKFPTCINSSC